MWWKRFKGSMMVAVACTGPCIAIADTIELRADEWCPFNCVPGSDAPGYMIELAAEALAPFGHTINYQTMSWARSLHLASEGAIDGVIGAIPEEAPDLVFGPPLGTYEDVVAFRKGEGRDISAEGALDGLRVGAINGYTYFGPVSSYIDANVDNRDLVEITSGDDALLINLRKLVAGRLDVVAEVRSVLVYNVAQLGIQDKIDITATTDSNNIYIAFTPAKEASQTYAAQLTEGIRKLKETGRFDEILAKYGQSFVEQSD